jgi:hypothetical protein
MPHRAFTYLFFLDRWRKAPEFYEGQVSVLDGVSDDGVDCEEDVVVVSSGGVGSWVASSAGSILFHGAGGILYSRRCGREGT